MIVIDNDLRENIYRHVRQAYPHEVCGILIGKGDSRKEVVEVHSVTNLNCDRARDRYELDPEEFQRIDAHARATGLSVLGFYHSHPDHPSAPSEFDTQRAWEGYSYIIVAVEGGTKVEIKSWTLNEQGVFAEEEIVSAD